MEGRGQGGVFFVDRGATSQRRKTPRNGKWSGNRVFQFFLKVRLGKFLQRPRKRQKQGSKSENLANGNPCWKQGSKNDLKNRGSRL